jgi:hypothetical protein
LKSSKLYYPLFVINYFSLFFISAIWLLNYEDGLTFNQQFGFATMNWSEKIAYIILNIVKFPFEDLLQKINIDFIGNILNAILVATILKFIFKNHKEKLFLIANSINLLFLLISLSIIFYYTFLIYWIN